jgi:hypothetical protein
MDAAPDSTSPMTEKVPWIAMKQGIFETSDGKMIQAGIARVPADEDFHPIEFYTAFPSAPAVFVSNLDPVDVVRVKGETEAEFTASAHAGFEDIEMTGECKWKGEGHTIVSASEGNSKCQIGLDKQACDAVTGEYTVSEEYTHHWRAPNCWADFWGLQICDWWDSDHNEQRWRDVSKSENNICEFHDVVIGKCRGVTPFDWGSCKGYVTSKDECTAHPECVWTTIDADHTAPLVEVHWLAVEKTEGGVLGAYPFIAGDTSVGDETSVSFDAGFTQVPLIYGSASGEANADVRVTGKDIGNFSMIVQGAAADEKVSYLVYNGQSSVGTAFKAVAKSLISYAYEMAEFGECEDDGSGVHGTRSRTVDCKRSDGVTVDEHYCPGTHPHETEACTLVRFYVLSERGGLCLGPEDFINKNGVAKKELAAKVEHCSGDKNKFKIESGQDGGFKLINAATNMCYCQRSSDGKKMIFRSADKCDQPNCNLERFDIAEDGTFKVAPVGRTGCVRTNRRRNSYGPIETASLAIGSTDNACGADGARFAMVKEGTLEISQYAPVKADCEGDCYLCYCNKYPDLQNAFCGGKTCIEPMRDACKNHWETYGKNEGRYPNPETCSTLGYKGWYEDKSGKMLTDQDRVDGDFPTSVAGMKGVGGLEVFALDFHLASPGPIQAVKVGFNYNTDWHIRRPEKAEVKCSSDGGATFGNAAVFQGDDDFKIKPASYYKDKQGSRKDVTFMVADVCGDDTDSFRVTITPKGMQGSKDKKSIIDEVTAYGPFSLS